MERAKAYCDPGYLKDEMENIINVFEDNGYSRKRIREAINTPFPLRRSDSASMQFCSNAMEMALCRKEGTVRYVRRRAVFPLALVRRYLSLLSCTPFMYIHE